MEVYHRRGKRLRSRRSHNKPPISWVTFQIKIQAFSKLNIQIYIFCQWYFLIALFVCAFCLDIDLNETEKRDKSREREEKRERKRERFNDRDLHSVYANESCPYAMNVRITNPIERYSLTNNMLKWHMYSIFNSSSITEHHYYKTVWMRVCAIQCRRSIDQTKNQPTQSLRTTKICDRATELRLWNFSCYDLMDCNRMIVKSRRKEKINNNRTKKKEKNRTKNRCLLTSSNLNTGKKNEAKTNAHFVNFHFKIGKKRNERKKKQQTKQNRIASYLRTTIGICDNFSTWKTDAHKRERASFGSVDSYN